MKRLRTFALALAATVAAMTFVAGPALAHVTVHSTDAKQGGYAVLEFRVPTESATASTTKLQVQFPADAPIPSVNVEPQPGWTFKTITSKLAKPVTTRDGDTITDAVSEIDWTAGSPASAIKPGEFQRFFVSAGPLPSVKVMQFSAIQTYSDGTVVKWNEVAAPGSTARPDHPKPALTLSATSDPAAAAASGSTTSSSSSDTGAVVLAVVALVVAAGALGVAVVSRARQARS